MLRTCASTVTTGAAAPRKLGPAHIKIAFTIQRASARTVTSLNTTVIEKQLNRADPPRKAFKAKANLILKKVRKKKSKSLTPA